MRKLFHFFFILDLLWLSLSAFPLLRIESFSWLELIPVFDIVMLLLHLSILVFAVVMRWRIGLLVIASVFWIGLVSNRHLIAQEAVSAPTQGESFRIATFNVKQFSNEPRFIDSLAKWALEQKIDVLCLQEFGLMADWPENKKKAQERVSALSELQYSDFSPYPGNVFGTALFSRFPVRLDSVIYESLPDFNEIKAYEVTLNTGSFILINAHLESYNQDYFKGLRSAIEKRSKQAILIQEYASLHTENTLVVGDFNTVAGTKNYDRLLQGKCDAQSQFGKGLSATHAYLPLRIDHVFCPQKWRIVEVLVDDPIPSDHRAVCVDFQLP